MKLTIVLIFAILLVSSEIPASEGFLTLMQLYNILQQQLTTTTTASSATQSAVTVAPSSSISATINIGNRINTTTTDGIDFGTNLTDIMITIGRAVAFDMASNENGVVYSTGKRRKRSPQFNLGSLIPNIPNILQIPTQAPTLPAISGLPQVPTDLGSLVPKIPGISNLNLSNFKIPGLQIPSLDSNSTSPIANMIEGYIVQYQQQANQLIQSGRSALETTLAPIKVFGETMKRAMDLFGNNGLFSMIQIASRFGLSVISCVKLEKFQAVGQAAIQSGQKCVADKLNEITALITDTSENIINATQDVDNLRQNMVICQNKDYSGVDVMVASVSRIFCYQSALFKIQKQTLLLPVAIAREISRADGIISTARPYILQCAANLTDALAGTTFDIGLEMGRCVGDHNQ